MCSEYLDISIHALLAESDGAYRGARQSRPHFYPRSPCGERPFRIAFKRPWKHFYPRSPCGERLLEEAQRITGLIFLSTLSLRRATACPDTATRRRRFLSTLSLRRATAASQATRGGQRFLSTLSLRRATSFQAVLLCTKTNFYPRSPCGERPAFPPRPVRRYRISIHALLAESDRRQWSERISAGISIHALLAESDVLLK